MDDIRIAWRKAPVAENDIVPDAVEDVLRNYFMSIDDPRPVHMFSAMRTLRPLTS
jgi:hypothetical protein